VSATKEEKQLFRNFKKVHPKLLREEWNFLAQNFLVGSKFFKVEHLFDTHRNHYCAVVLGEFTALLYPSRRVPASPASPSSSSASMPITTQQEHNRAVLVAAASASASSSSDASSTKSGGNSAGSPSSSRYNTSSSSSSSPKSTNTSAATTFKSLLTSSLDKSPHLQNIGHRLTKKEVATLYICAYFSNYKELWQHTEVSLTSSLEQKIEAFLEEHPTIEPMVLSTLLAAMETALTENADALDSD